LEKFQMKKTLVAVAALSAVSAFAQSSMSFTGLFDRGYLLTGNSGYGGQSTKSVGSNSGTTRFEVRGTEDLGGGMKANFFIETDWNSKGGTTDSSSAVTALGTFANSENWVNIETAGGTLKLGAPNNELFVAVAAVGQPGFSTGVGSIYSSNFSIQNGIGTGNAAGTGSSPTYVANATTAANVGARNVRQDNTIKYESPSFSGLKFAIGWSPKNDYVSTAADGTATKKGNVGTTEYGIRYTNGPVDVMYAAVTYDVGTQVVASTATPYYTIVNTLAGQSQNNTYLGANYMAMPGLKVFLGLGTSKTSDGSTVNTSSTNYGVSYTQGQVDFMYNFAKVDDKATANQDRKLTGLGANYNLSKMTYLYYRYDKINYNTVTSLISGDQTRNAVGFAVKF